MNRRSFLGIAGVVTAVCAIPLILVAKSLGLPVRAATTEGLVTVERIVREIARHENEGLFVNGINLNKEDWLGVWNEVNSGDMTIPGVAKPSAEIGWGDELMINGIRVSGFDFQGFSFAIPRGVIRISATRRLQ